MKNKRFSITSKSIDLRFMSHLNLTITRPIGLIDAINKIFCIVEIEIGKQVEIDWNLHNMMKFLPPPINTLCKLTQHGEIQSKTD